VYDELVVIKTDWERDRDATLLRACLTAHHAAELAHARFTFISRLWLVLTAVVGALAVWPGASPGDARAPQLLAWLALGAATLGFSQAERYWKRKLDDRLARLAPAEAQQTR